VGVSIAKVSTAEVRFGNRISPTTPGGTAIGVRFFSAGRCTYSLLKPSSFTA
jgi:hypothetical protein